MALASGARYHLVLSDWHRDPQKKEGLPEGLRLLRAMRKRGISTPLIFYAGLLTSELFLERRAKAIAAGATGLTASPYELLRWAIAELVRSSALEPQSPFGALPA